MTISIVQLLIFRISVKLFLKLYLIILIMFMIYVVLISYMQIKNQQKLINCLQ